VFTEPLPRNRCCLQSYYLATGLYTTLCIFNWSESAKQQYLPRTCIILYFCCSHVMMLAARDTVFYFCISYLLCTFNRHNHNCLTLFDKLFPFAAAPLFLTWSATFMVRELVLAQSSVICTGEFCFLIWCFRQPHSSSQLITLKDTSVSIFLSWHDSMHRGINMLKS
jgi:hypothetical protein